MKKEEKEKQSDTVHCVEIQCALAPDSKPSLLPSLLLDAAMLEAVCCECISYSRKTYKI